MARRPIARLAALIAAIAGMSAAHAADFVVSTTAPAGAGSLAAAVAAAVETPVGTITITFADGNRATYAYTVDGIQQVKTIERQVFTGTGTVCQ